jgi:hypothetical protein
MSKTAAGATYAVVVRDGEDLFAVLTVNRKPSGDVYANVLRPHDPDMKPQVVITPRDSTTQRRTITKHSSATYNDPMRNSAETQQWSTL